MTFKKKAARLYRRVAGRVISVYCTEFDDEPDEFGFTGTSTGGASQRVSKKRRPIHTGDATPNQDYCRVWLAARTVKRRGKRTRLAAG